MKLLLHTCCGPCFLGSWRQLSGWEVTSFFYNPNIQPVEEYGKRFKNLRNAAVGKGVGIIKGVYDTTEHEEVITGDKSFPDRCINCYKLRLGKTAETAKEKGFDAFSTTLLVSPYQRHGELKEIGKLFEDKLGIKFFYDDFRPSFRKGQDEAKEKEIYRQQYCGCLLSKKEAV